MADHRSLSVAELAVAENARHIQMLTDGLNYKDWRFEIKADGGWTKSLVILLNTEDSETVYQPGMSVQILVNHHFQIPHYYMPSPELERWLFGQILLVERHEAMEHYRRNGVAVFYPQHGQGADPYKIRYQGEATG